MFNIVTPYIKFGDGDKEYMFWDEGGTYSLDDDEKTYTFRNLITMLYETHNELPSEALFFLPSIPSEVSLKSYSGNITVEYYWKVHSFWESLSSTNSDDYLVRRNFDTLEKFLSWVEEKEAEEEEQ